MTYEIKKATIVIDMNDYLNGLQKNPNFIDGSASSFEPNEIFDCGSFETLEEAEAAISHTVYLNTTDDYASISYEYIAGSETVYFTEVMYQNGIYAIDKDFCSPECYKEVTGNTFFKDKAVSALKNFCDKSGEEFSEDDEVYVWSWFNEDGHRLVKINSINHSPEGLLVMVGHLATIDDWWDNEWNQEP